MEKYAEICTVAVTHMPAGRGGNEDEIAKTVLGSLGRVGYQASEHPLYGFGSGPVGAPELPIGLSITIVRRVSKWLVERLEAKRQREVDALLPECVVQLVASSNSGTRYGPPSNLAAELFAILPAILADLRAADYHRRYTFMVYASAPEFEQVSMSLSEDNMRNKDLLKVVRACSAKPKVCPGPDGAILDLSFARKHWWLPRKLSSTISAADASAPRVGQRAQRQRQTD
ncbi:hypothetical protein [Arthrobacter koreensis]|uniref:hypothetical protein n=1 Tax=Arthrobacter koreensis TaxID=199136 RepID=UPI0037FCD69D